MSQRPEPFREYGPTGIGPVILSSPHNGAFYPPAMLRGVAVERGRLRTLEDGPTDLLARPACMLGATVLAATYARGFVDLNRGADELDPELLMDAPSDLVCQVSAKVSVGLGVVPSRLGGAAIYRRPIAYEDVRARLAQAYLPFHRRLGRLLLERWSRFGAAFLLDCHSMPRESACAMGVRPIDIAVGDRFGASCGSGLCDQALSILTSHGFTVARNRPYAGGFITEHYGRPGSGVHALQLEIRRDLFMDPDTLRPHEGAASVATAIRSLVTGLAAALANSPLPAGDRPPDPALPPAPLDQFQRAAD
jgi:N-formylglutamate amidohydrolase